MIFEAGRVSTDHRIFDVTDADGDRLVIRQYTGPDGFTVYIRGADSLVVGLELTVDQVRSLAKVLTEALPTVEEPAELTTTSAQADRAWALQEARERFPHESPAAVLAVAEWILNPDEIRDAVGTTDED